MAYSVKISTRRKNMEPFRRASDAMIEKIRLQKRDVTYTKEELMRLYEKEYDVVLTEESTKNPFYSVYKIVFKTKQDYIMFLLKWT